MKVIIKYKKSHLKLRKKTWHKLARKMWGIPKNEKLEVDFRVGNFTEINRDLYFEASLRLGIYDDAWFDTPLDHRLEMLQMRHYKKLQQAYVLTSSKEPMLINKRAFYIFVYYIATNLPGKISEDNGKTWISPKKYIAKYQSVIRMPHKKVEKISMKEAYKLPTTDEKLNKKEVLWY